WACARSAASAHLVRRRRQGLGAGEVIWDRERSPGSLALPTLELKELEIQLPALQVDRDEANFCPLPDAHLEARGVRNEVRLLLKPESAQRLALDQPFDPRVVELHKKTEVRQR